MINKRVHLVGANTKNKFGMEYFVSKAFKSLGYEVLETDYRVMGRYEVSNRIRYITDAEFTLVIKGDRICPEDIFACRIPTALWLQDSVEANQEADFVIQTKASLFDIVYSFANNELPFYKQFNKNSYWLPLGADVDTHHAIKIPNKTIEVGFCGSLNNNRINIMNYLLDKGVPIQYNYDMDSYPEIIGNTKINLNVGITGSGYQQRVFEICSMGGFLLTNKVAGEEIFKDKKHLVYYNDFNHLYELICYYIDKPEEIERISQAGQKEVLENHRYVHRVKQIVGDICQMKL